MNQHATADAYGVLDETDTLTIRRMLPGPIERVWAYLTESELRRQWLAAGEMEMTVGSSFTLTWRNDELTDPPGERPESFAEDHSMTCRIVELDPPHRLAISWGSTGGVSFTLEPRGGKVLLTLVHSRIADRNTRLNVSAGWHVHLDLLVARASGEAPQPFWDRWRRLKGEYDQRLPS